MPVIAGQKMTAFRVDGGEEDRLIFCGFSSMPFGSVSPVVASSAISICSISRYSRARLSAASRFLSASSIAYAELTNLTSARFHNVNAGDASARHAAENRMLASRNARSIFSGRLARRAGRHQGRGPAP